MPKQNKDNKLTIDELIEQDMVQSQANQDYLNPTQETEEISEETWYNNDEEQYEGQLSVDVYETTKSLIIKSAIAGVSVEDLDISLNNDTITVKGVRSQTEDDIEEENFYCRECYWGGFSRSIILPVDVKSDQIKAEIEQGILTITLPKANKPKIRGIKIKEIKEKTPPSQKLRRTSKKTKK